MSIKYSGILAADEVLSAGNDDIIVLAIVDGGAPTGYTTKAIKKSNLLDFLPLAGGTMLGDIELGSNTITNGIGSISISVNGFGHTDGVDTIGMNSTNGQFSWFDGGGLIDSRINVKTITAPRTWTMPDESGNVALERIKAFQTLVDAANISWNYALGYNAEVTLTASRILDEPTNTADGDYGTLVINQDGVGSHTLTLPASFKVVNGGGGAITLSTAANSVDSISWVKKGSDFLVSVGLNFD